MTNISPVAKNVALYISPNLEEIWNELYIWSYVEFYVIFSVLDFKFGVHVDST